MTSVPKRFSGRRVLVTGGNSGIGFAIAERFASEGASLILAGRDPEKGKRALEQLSALGGPCQFFTADLSSESDVSKLAKKVEHLDILINNAGLGGRRLQIEPETPPGERWDRVRGPNLDAAYLVSAYFLPLLKASKGAIVNISSTATMHGNWGLYCIAKAGSEALTRSFAVEASPVRVNCVSPGWITTEENKVPASGTADGSWNIPPSLENRMGTGQEIAGAVAFLASDDASFVTGQTLVVDGGMSITDYPSSTLLQGIGDKLFSGALSSDAST